jgi:hypothetical protein
LLQTLITGGCSTWRSPQSQEVYPLKPEQLAKNIKSPGAPIQWNELWKVQDLHGQYHESALFKFSAGKLLVEQKLFEQDLEQYLEKNRSIFGLQGKNVLPLVSQQEFWIDQQHYRNEMIFLWKEKLLKIKAQEPGKPLKEYQFTLLPQGSGTSRTYCLLHLLASCLVYQGVVDQLRQKQQQAQESSVPVTIIASSFPFSAELYQPSFDGWFGEGQVKLEPQEQGAKGVKVSIDIFGQVLVINYNAQQVPQEISWVAQGLLKNNSVIQDQVEEY